MENKLSPAQIADERQAIEDCIGKTYREAIARCGISPDQLAALRLEQLKATKINHIKMRGSAEISKDAKGYKEVAVSGSDEFTETLIQHEQPDWQVRERAMTAIEVLMGYNIKEEERNRGTVIIVNSMIPEPQPAISDEKLRQAWAHREKDGG